MSRTLSDVYDEAERAFAARRYEAALRGYFTVLHGAPRFTKARYRVADTLLNTGRRARAVEVYKSLAWHCIRSGDPLLGLVICKMLLALEPSYRDLLYIFAELYSSESDRVSDAPAPPPLPVPANVAVPSISELPPSALFDAAARLAADTSKVDRQPDRLPQIPLFSALTEDAFLSVLERLRLRRVADGERIIIEGEPGASFFIVASGTVSVSRTLGGTPALLARLHSGAVFGEMALISRQPRSATVTAIGEVDLLEMTREDVDALAGEIESVQVALRRFTRGRLLANLAATSPLFAGLSKPDGRTLMSAFRAERVGRGDIIIEEGEASRGIYVVIRGAFRVHTRAEGDVAQLGPGDVFGEIAVIRGTPTTASVIADKSSEVLMLPVARFQRVVQRYPEVLQALIQMSEARLKGSSAPSGEIAGQDHMILL